MIYNKKDIPADLLRYFVRAEIGLEATPDAFVAEMVAVFRDVRRVLRNDGTLWLNLGDSYSGNSASGGEASRTNTGGAHRRTGAGFAKPGKPKDLLGIPWRVAFALQADGWYLRSDIIWHKPNPMPESVTDRPTKSHEYLFLLAKSERYYYDADAIREPYEMSSWTAESDAAGETARGADGIRSGAKGAARAEGAADGKRYGRTSMLNAYGNGGRNRRTVWTVATQPYSGAHFATFPPALIEPCILAGSARGDTVLDPFGGAGTTGLVADRLGRDAILCELNPTYAEMARRRITDDAPLFGDVA